jgi:ribonucleoside-diphosphate reductase alpha chain
MIINTPLNETMDKASLDAFIDSTTAPFPNIDTTEYKEKVFRSIQSKNMTTEQITSLLIMTALEYVDEVSHSWSYVTARIFLEQLYNKASKNRSYNRAQKYGNFYQLQINLVEKGIYSSKILEKYRKEEIEELAKIIQPDRDLLFDYIGIHTLATRYLVTDHEKNTYELPQERWLTIALFLMQDEPKSLRASLVREAYWALSNLYMTVATPTLANAGLAHGQLSSCFIDTVEDSLIDIYNSNTDVARLSKGGGGIGVYIGMVRSRGSSIKGFKGASSGIIPWIKQLNMPSVSINSGDGKGQSLSIWTSGMQIFYPS